MSGKELDLKQSGVKVITLKSSKGLEFPIVALAGFVGSSYPVISPNASEEERDELLSQERRSMFVGMTRAMRSLLVVLSEGNDSPSIPFITFHHLFISLPPSLGACATSTFPASGSNRVTYAVPVSIASYIPRITRFVWWTPSHDLLDRLVDDVA